jgi:hypothetical protein
MSRSARSASDSAASGARSGVRESALSVTGAGSTGFRAADGAPWHPNAMNAHVIEIEAFKSARPRIVRFASCVPVGSHPGPVTIMRNPSEVFHRIGNADGEHFKSSGLVTHAAL